jgi:copper chaperone CopZ
MNSFTTGLLALLLSVAFSVTTKAQAVNTTTTDTVKTVTFNVKGITCASDLPIINKNVENLKGVASCEAVGKAGPTTAFKVAYNPLLVSEKEIIKAVEDSPSCDFPDQKPYRVKGKN